MPLSALLLALSTPAGGSGDPAAVLALRTGAAHVAASAEGLRGDGEGFEVAFEPRGPVFQPVYGRTATDAPWLGFELESVARGQQVIARGGAVEPQGLPVPGAAGALAGVLYDRGPVDELYEPRGRGLEQSFVLERRPAGEGDLVVRLRLTGPLALEPHRVEGADLVFARADLAALGGVRVGAVTGIDAAGASAAGALRRDGQHLELVLPAAFVDGARYPLVVDPWIGGPFTVAASAEDDYVRDVVYDASAGAFLVILERHVSSSDVRVRAQRVDHDGNLIGGTVFLSSTGICIDPRAADVRSSQRFAVAWNEETGSSSRIRLQTVDALTAAVGTVITLASDHPDELGRVDIAGQVATSQEKRVVVVYEHEGVGIKTSSVIVNPTGTPSLVSTSTVVPAPPIGSVHSPAISRTNLFEDQYLLVYALTVSTESDIRALLVNGQGQKVFANPLAVTATTDEGEYSPEVDGDGRTFVVAWSTTASSYDTRVASVKVTPGGLAASPSVLALAGSLSSIVHFPRVAHAPGKALVTSSLPYLSPDFLPVVIGFDPDTLAICEDPTWIYDLLPSEASLAVASVSSGGVLGDGRALMTWTRDSPVAGLDVIGQLLDATGPGGGAVDLGGGCGPGGTSSVAGPVAIGNGYLQILLSGADPSASVGIMNVAIGASPTLSCGACAWTPFELTFVQNVGGGGTGQVIGIPCNTGLVGLNLDTQWTVFTPGASPCALFPGFSLSNRLRLTIGL